MEKPDKKLFLLDAMALIYRAHFAFSKNPRVNSKGINTGATLGFTNTLTEILRKEKPTHIAIAFDTPAPTFRHEEFELYKANREKQPEDITIAIPYVKTIAAAFNVPVLELDGYEADDIIGTIAKKASEAGFEVFMMTPDKDYSQLVSDHVYLYKPAFMGNGVEVLGTEEVIKKWDIAEVEQVTDILGLQGDAVDNIPGIPGIGAKTAVKLIRQYGSVENLIAHADELKGKQKENVINFSEQAILSKKLATIHTEVPVAFDEQSMKYEGFDEQKLKTVFQELEFRTLAKRLLGEKTNSAPEGQMSMFETKAEPQAMQEKGSDEELIHTKDDIYTTAHAYHLVDTPELRKKLVEYLHLQKEFCFDTETTSLQAISAQVIGIAFSYVAHEAYYVPVPDDFSKAREVINEFRAIFENQHILKIGQNIKYDVLVLKKYGIAVEGPLFDTMLAHYLIEPDKRHNMDVLAENYLNYTPVSIETLIGKKGKKQGNMKDVPVEKVVEYAGEDADITLQLRHQLAPILKEHDHEKLYYEVETPLVNVLAGMEHEGVNIDTETLGELSAEMAKDSAEVESQIYEIAGEEFNIASPKQLGEILFNKLKLVEKPKRTKTGLYATGEDVLSKLASEHTIARKILDFRELQKLKSTYVDALPLLISTTDNRIHTSYNQAVAATGRLSSTDPNLQNIPIRTSKGREIRKAFIPRNDDYLLMSADYSQIELRLMACFAQDQSMIEAFKKGIDIHSTTASRIFKVPIEQVDADMRRKAKTANFGIIYGISAFGLSQRLGIPRKEAAYIINSYFEEFDAVKKYMDDAVNQAREKGYSETILGRKRYLRDINSRNATIRGYAERNAINAPIQGSAADMIKLAMIHIHRWLSEEKLQSKMILQVHDELVFDAHKNEIELLKEKVAFFMKNAMSLDVPMLVEVGVGKNWLAAH